MTRRTAWTRRFWRLDGRSSPTTACCRSSPAPPRPGFPRTPVLGRPWELGAFPFGRGPGSSSIGGVLSTGALRAHLLAARLAGPVATSREESLRSYRLFAARDPRVLIGIDPEWSWKERDLIGLMADKCGVSGDLRHTSGHDVIDPERTLVALDAFAERLEAVAQRSGAVLLGTGHPHRLLGFYAAIADALS